MSLARNVPSMTVHIREWDFVGFYLCGIAVNCKISEVPPSRLLAYSVCSECANEAIHQRVLIFNPEIEERSSPLDLGAGV